MKTNTLETKEGWTRIGAKSFPILESENENARISGVLNLRKRYTQAKIRHDKMILMVSDLANLVEFVLKNPEFVGAKELIFEAIEKAGVEK